MIMIQSERKIVNYLGRKRNHQLEDIQFNLTVQTLIRMILQYRSTQFKMPGFKGLNLLNQIIPMTQRNKQGSLCINPQEVLLLLQLKTRMLKRCGQTLGNNILSLWNSMENIHRKNLTLMGIKYTLLCLLIYTWSHQMSQSLNSFI